MKQTTHKKYNSKKGGNPKRKGNKSKKNKNKNKNENKNENTEPVQFVLSSGTEYSKVIDDGKESEKQIDWNLEYDPDTKQGTVNISSNIDGEKETKKKTINDSEVKSLFEMRENPTPISIRIQQDFLNLQPHTYRQGNNKKPSLVPVDFRNDPLFDSFPNIEHEFYVVPPITYAKINSRKDFKTLKNAMEDSTEDSTEDSSEESSEDSKNNIDKESEYESDIDLEDYVKSFSMKSKRVYPEKQKTRKNKKTKTNQKVLE
tara:strand:- start:2918 stop:3694 length:777 start_codon:yes stop_codon:yes gene_type:complete